MKKTHQIAYSMLLLSSLFCKQIKDPYLNHTTLKKHLMVNKERVHGWCSDEKSTKMLELVLHEKPETCVEIGVYGGSSIFPTALALKYNKSGVVYAVDPWKNQDCIEHHTDGDPNKEFWGTIDLEVVYNSFVKMLSTFNLYKHVKILRMTSKNALSQIPGSIDILHIDGNHQEEACYFDTVNYLPKVKIGGYIWFDDAGWYDTKQKIHTTKKSFDYLLNTCEVISYVDNKNCYLLRKVK